MAYRDSTTNSGTGTILSVTVPVGVQANDIIILAATTDGSLASLDQAHFPAGFTLFAEVAQGPDGGRAAYGWKRATGADSGSYTFAADGESQDWVCQAWAFSGRDTSSAPTTAATNNTSANTSAVTATVPTITAVAGDDLLTLCFPDVSVTGAFNVYTSRPAGYTADETAELGFANLAGDHVDNVAAGATGTKTYVFSLTSGNSGWYAVNIRIPAAVSLLGTTTSSTSMSSTSSSISSTSSSTSSTSTSVSTTSVSTSSTSSSLSTSSTSTSLSSTSSSTSSTSLSSTSSSTSLSSTSSSISSTSMSSTSLSSTSSSTSISSTSSSFSSTSSSMSSTSASTSSTSFSSTSSSSSTSSTTLPPPNYDFSYRDGLTIPTTAADLINKFTYINYSNVLGDDGDYFIEYGSEYMITNYQRKHVNNTDSPTFTWRGRTTLTTLTSPLLIQIYNVNSATWETLAIINKQPADTDFSVSVSQTSNASNYYDSQNIVTFRSYQQVI